jgi:isopentenyl-diphosphate Delta-isomerase
MIDNEEQVILVNASDEQIGVMEKMEAHKKGFLHRAFSVFVFDENDDLIIQQRALGKYHSPGLWTNTCCSHPRPGEETGAAAHRRLKEEMGFDTELEKVFDFVYRAEFENGLTEHEFDHVFVGKYSGKISPAKEEVHAWMPRPIKELKKEIKESPENFTVWFRVVFDKYAEKISK